MLVHFLVAGTLRNCLGRHIVARWQVAKGRDQGLELQKLRVPAPQPRLQALKAVTQNTRILPWVHRETVLVIEHAERALFRIERKFEFAVPQNRAVVVTQHRQQHPARRPLGGGIPVDVEVIGEP